LKQNRILRNRLWALALHGASIFPPARELKFKAEEKIIRRKCSHLFDEKYYLETNPDVAGYSGTPLAHFIRYGWREGRNPHLLFNVTYYCQQFENYPRVNPLVHFQLIGRRQEKSPTRWFSYDHYLSRNTDVLTAKIEPYEHFVKYGVAENRSASDQFDGLQYIARYSDVRRSGMPALYHYLRYGLAEGRVGIFRIDMGSVAGIDIKEGETFDSRKERTQALRSILSMKRKRSGGKPAVDVIIPVYRDYYLTLACIWNALRMKNRTPYEVVVIDDKSPEPELTAALQRIAAKGLITLIRHEENKGFVKSVNDGMRLHPDRDVILLNSDAEVYGNWIDRLRTIAHSEKSISTVCPLTNSGTICSYPKFCQDNSVPPDICVEELDQLAARLNAGQYVPAPTAVGFCMYIKREVLEQVGLFDEDSFGTGYGEENDFCLRAQAAGWRDVIAMDTFVHHLGSASFQGEKAERVRHASEVIGKRYPNYHADVQTYIRQDPALSYRARLDHERLLRLSSKKNLVIVSHTRGGGTEQHIQERTERYRKEGWSVFRLYADPLNRKMARLSHADALNMPNAEAYDITAPIAVNGLVKLLRELRIEAMEIHHLGDFWGNAPLDFLEVAEAAGIPHDFVVHDYLSICPRINLVDETGMYCGEPDEQGCTTCLKRFGSDYGQPQIDEWRHRYNTFLSKARKVIVPNGDVQRRLGRYFPDLSIDVQPHDDVVQAPHVPRERKPGEKLRIGTIGAISPIKGLHILRQCARYAACHHLPVEFVVVGYTSNDLESAKWGLKVTGPYLNANVADEIAKAKLDAIFIPSTCPETYSFTLSNALTSGLPIICFNIGSLIDRTKNFRNVRCIPLNDAKNLKRILTAIINFVNYTDTEEDIMIENLEV